MKHLVAIGCKTIGHIGGLEVLQINAYRIEGYLSALKEAGLEANSDYLVYSNFD